jgi:hypothetical protein
MLRTKTTLGGTGSINADNRGTEPAFVGVVPAQARSRTSKDWFATARKKMERARKNHLQKGGESVPTAVLTAAARRACPGWPRLRGHPFGLGLDRPEHGGRLDWSGLAAGAHGRRCGRRRRSLGTCYRFPVPHFYRLEGKRKRETYPSCQLRHRLGTQSIIAQIDASNIASTHILGQRSVSTRSSSTSPCPDRD